MTTSVAEARWVSWDRFLESHPAGGFMQSSWWADFRVDAGYGHFGSVLKHDGAVIGGALVLKFSRGGVLFYYMPDGPVLPDDESAAAEVFEAILESLEERRRTEREPVSHLRIEPRWERLPPFVRGFLSVPVLGDPYMEPRDTLCVDLRVPEESLLAQMKPKGRYNVGVAQRHGVTVVEDASERGVADFLALYRATMDRQGLKGKPPDYFRKLVSLLASRQKESLYFAECQGERLAAALVVQFGRRATYFYGASSDRRRDVMAPYLLHFEIMRRARAAGCEGYDFWGLAPPGAPADHPWEGFSAFKRKFGGREVHLVPTLDYVYEPAAYRLYGENTG